MSKFLDTLDVWLVDDTSNDGRGTWELRHDFRYVSDVAQMLIKVPKGFRTDFASVPRIPLAFWLTGDSSHEAAVVHDYLYQFKPVDRKTADAALREACEVSGIPAWRRWMIWAGVRVGGSTPWENDKPDMKETT